MYTHRRRRKVSIAFSANVLYMSPAEGGVRPLQRRTQHREQFSRQWKQKPTKLCRTSCQTQAGIGHSAPGTWADMCGSGAGAGSSVGADTKPNHWRSKHKWKVDTAGRRRFVNMDGGGRVHAADGAPSQNADTRENDIIRCTTDESALVQNDLAAGCQRCSFA